MAYPLSQAMSAFIDKTLSFTAPDDSLDGSRQAYSQMCRAFTPSRPPTLVVEDLPLAGVPIRAYHRALRRRSPAGRAFSTCTVAVGWWGPGFS